MTSGRIPEDFDFLFNETSKSNKAFYLLSTLHKLYLEDLEDSNTGRTFCVPGLNFE